MDTQDKNDIIFSFEYINTISQLVYNDMIDNGTYLFDIFLIKDKIHFHKMNEYKWEYCKKLWYLTYIFNIQKDDIYNDLIHMLEYYERYWLNKTYDPLYEYVSFYKKIKRMFDFS